MHRMNDDVALSLSLLRRIFLDEQGKYFWRIFRRIFLENIVGGARRDIRIFLEEREYFWSRARAKLIQLRLCSQSCGSEKNTKTRLITFSSLNFQFINLRKILF